VLSNPYTEIQGLFKSVDKANILHLVIESCLCYEEVYLLRHTAYSLCEVRIYGFANIIFTGKDLLFTGLSLVAA